jgi:hypothetical protein
MRIVNIIASVLAILVLFATISTASAISNKHFTAYCGEEVYAELLPAGYTVDLDEGYDPATIEAAGDLVLTETGTMTFTPVDEGTSGGYFRVQATGPNGALIKWFVVSIKVSGAPCCPVEVPEPEEVLPDNYCDGFAVVVKSPMDMQEFGVGDTVQVVTGNNAQNCDFRVRLFVDGASAPSSTMQFYEPGEYEIEAVATDTNPASPMYGEIISSDSVTISVIE